MKSNTVGKNTSKPKVTTISAQGIWILANQHEYFLPYESFPEFKDATIADILNLNMEHGEYLFGPSLRIELELDCIENPEKYPLRYKK